MKALTSKTKSFKIFIIALLLGLFIVPETAFAQPPKWAPAHGYRAKTRYVYFPQQNFYYDLQSHHYLYANNGGWSVSVAVPRPFISINLGVVPQVQLNYYGGYPYYYNSDHRVKYKSVKVVQPRSKVVYTKQKYSNDNGQGGKVKFKNKGNGNGKGHGNGKGKNK